IVDSTLRARPLDGRPHVEVEGAGGDTQVPLQPLRVDGLAVGLGRAEPRQDLIVANEGRADVRARSGNQRGTAQGAISVGFTGALLYAFHLSIKRHREFLSQKFV